MSIFIADRASGDSSLPHSRWRRRWWP